MREKKRGKKRGKSIIFCLSHFLIVSAVENTQIKKLLQHLSVSQGKKYDDPRSKKEIPHFIEFHNLNKEEILDPLDSFATFNEFFYRKLKPTARPISEPNNPVCLEC